MNTHLILFIFCCLFGTRSIARPPDKPNIILIMADDMGYECLGSNGSLSYHTPELDKMAVSGIRFTQCFSQPLCTPSRVKIMTGRYNFKNYIDFGYLDVKEKTFGNILRDAGYQTLVAGKWQLNGVNTNIPGNQDQNRPHHFGFDEYCLWWFTGRGPRYANPTISDNGKIMNTTIDDYGPDLVSDYIVDFIERKKNQPFFVYYPMILVHSPFQPTPDSPEWKDPGRRMEDDPKYFKDMVAYTDKVVAKINNKLQELGLAENTMVIFTGDNGTHTSIVTETENGTYPGGKGQLQENGIHVPMVVKWPAAERNGYVSHDLVEFSDFLPTFSEAANQELPENIDGKSFLNLMKNKPFTPRDAVFIHYYPRTSKVSDRNGCIVRSTRYKLYQDGRFYDLESDPWEEYSLFYHDLDQATKEHYQSLQAELDSRPLWDFSKPRQLSKK